MADVFFNRTVTVFNHCVDNLLGEETWYPTVLTDVRLLETKGANVHTSGIAEADAARLHIMTDNLPKPYLDPIAWSKTDDKTESFTLCQDKDFFVVGNVSSVTPTTDNFLKEMKSNYDGVYQITNVDKYDIIKHFEVGGR